MQIPSLLIIKTIIIFRMTYQLLCKSSLAKIGLKNIFDSLKSICRPSMILIEQFRKGETYILIPESKMALYGLISEIN